VSLQTRFADGTFCHSYEPLLSTTYLQDSMRLISPLLMVWLAGCSSGGQVPFLQASASSVESCPVDESCQGNGECGAGDCGAEDCNWFCAHGWCLHGRHPHYKRIPDNLLNRSRARQRARSDLRKLDHDQCLSCDYRLGYEQAYLDVSQGACGDVPALPPANYWSTCARSPEGHQKAQQWFSGYAAGAARAKAIYEPFNKVAYSQFGCPPWDQPSPVIDPAGADPIHYE